MKWLERGGGEGEKEGEGRRSKKCISILGWAGAGTASSETVTCEAERCEMNASCCGLTAERASTAYARARVFWLYYSIYYTQKPFRGVALTC